MSHFSTRSKVVFDCNLLIQAVAFEGSAGAKCLRLVESGAVELLVSGPTLGELRRVLGYDRILAISPSMTQQRIGAFVQRLTFRATFVRHVRHVMSYPRDPSDEPYINLAVAGKARYLVTSDRDLLALMTGYSALCKQFRRKIRPLRVVNPVDFLRAVT